MIIKVCGMRDADNIRQLDEAQIADWMGFIFYDKSSRNVTSLPEYMPRHNKRVGVFVNEPIEGILERVNTFGLDIVQLHGNESADFCHELKKKLADDVKIIKMFQISSYEDLKPCAEYEFYVDYFLFETKCESYGGSGRKFDWKVLNCYPGLTPFILTGGIGPDDVDKIKAYDHPLCRGIDLNSQFETAPALKNIESLTTFINKIRK